MSIDFPKNWKQVVLEDALDALIDYRGKTPKKVDKGIPLITAKVVKSGRILPMDEFIADEDYESWMVRGIPQVSDIVVTTEAPLGEVAQIKNANVALAQRIVTLRGKVDFLENDFLLFLMQSDFVQNQLEARATGSTVKGIKQSELRKIILPIPPIAEQKCIGKILSDLDDKIHLNNQINQTLESIAQAIFKSWFIDFEPVRAKIAAKQTGQDPERAAMCAISGKSEAELEQMVKEDFAELHATAALFPDELVESELGEVPKGWGVSTVGDQIQTVGGATPSTKNAEFWDNGEHNWTTPKDLSNLTNKILLNTDRKITDAGLKKISSGLLPKDTVLMSSRAPVGYLALAKIEVAINQGYIAILPNTKYSAEYLIQWCEANMSEIKGRASGTTFQEISKKNFREIDFICPDEKIVAGYTKIVKPLYDEISSKAKENHNLINLRDTLLPKLLSGEIDLLGFTGDD
ncbi:restriction endonuclease subunit S [Acinetobacter sp. LF10]|uniref:restriction endonuclease subunit S n=1 Tax=Acinetobacter sp. LF10 TaxID=3403576 RepID=UPI003B218C39